MNVFWLKLSYSRTRPSKRPQTSPNFFAILALPWLAENDVISLLIGRAECDSIVDKLGHFVNEPIRRKMTTFSANRTVGFGDAFIYLGPRADGFRNCKLDLNNLCLLTLSGIFFLILTRKLTNTVCRARRVSSQLGDFEWKNEGFPSMDMENEFFSILRRRNSYNFCGNTTALIPRASVSIFGWL